MSAATAAAGGARHRMTGAVPRRGGARGLDAWRARRQAKLSTTCKDQRHGGRRRYGSFLEEWRKFKLPAALGFSCLAVLQMKHVMDREKEKSEQKRGGEDKGVEPVEFGGPWSSWSLRAVENVPPYRWMSNIWGKIASTPLPFDWMKRAVYGGWTAAYDCKLDEARYPIDHYSSLSDFFLRPLRDGVRQVDVNTPGSLVSPVDGRVLHVGTTDLEDAADLRVESVKGNSYRVEDLIGRHADGLDERAKRSRGKSGRKLQTVVMYLAPGDYHHFHSPADWRVTQRRHFAGSLMPVRPWAVKYIEDLYCKNERVVLNGSWEGGFFSFVAVGALNVGSIDITFDSELKTNTGSWLPHMAPPAKTAERAFPFPIETVRGQPIGSFNLGSTVVLVFESSADFVHKVKPGQVVRVGESIGTDCPEEPSRAAVAAPPWPGQETAVATKQRLEALRDAK